VVQEPAAAFGGIGRDFVPGRVAQVPELTTTAGFVRDAYLAGAGLAESGQQCQQIIARHQARLPRPWSDLRPE